jgi:hypothetical protein
MGRGARKAFEQPVLIMHNASPDGKWLVAWAPLHGNGPAASQAFRLDGGAPVLIGSNFDVRWSLDRGVAFITGTIIAPGRTYVIPLSPEETLRHIPAGGFRSEEEIALMPGARRIDAKAVPGPSAGVYAFYRGISQRNLYRIPIP